MLSAFMAADHTLSTAATVLVAAPSTIAYWIPKLCRCGLLREVRTERRRGAPMRWYRAPVAYFVPMSAAPPQAPDTYFAGGRTKVLEQFLAGLDEEHRRDPASGVRFTSSGAVGVDVEPVVSRSVDEYTDFWGTIDLTREQLGSLATELADVVRRYRALDGGPVRVVVHAGAVARAGRTRRRRSS